MKAPTGKIPNIEALRHISSPQAHIYIERDTRASMARLLVNGKLVLEARDGEFTPEHEGGWHKDMADRYGRFASPETMADTIAAAIVMSVPDGYEIHSGHYISGRE